MAYPQYTKCVDIQKKKYPGNPLNAAPWVGIAALLLFGLGAVGALLFTAALYLLVCAYCLWWLYDRLICLGGERCAIGYLGGVEKPGDKTGLGAFDTDYSMNLLLAPHQAQEVPSDYFTAPPGTYVDRKQAMLDVIANDGIQGNLIRKQTDKIGGYAFEGDFSTFPGADVTSLEQPYLHCEFEGGGVYQLYQAAKAALAFAAIGSAFCWIPIIGWIACAVAHVIAAVVFIAGIVNALNDKGKPDVLDPATGRRSGELHVGEDVLFVRGEWVFDTAHEGWNEFHPIRDCQRVARVKPLTYSMVPGQPSNVIDWEDAISAYMVSIGAWRSAIQNGQPTILQDRPVAIADWTGWVDAWCQGFTRASASLTVAAQQRPENQWEVHPAIDGCVPDRPPEPR